MIKALPQAWSDLSSNVISEEAVRQHFQASANCKLYVNSYDAGQTIEIKASHAFQLFVLEGNCELSIAGTANLIDTAQYMALDEGVFACTAGPTGVRLIKVFQRN